MDFLTVIGLQVLRFFILNELNLNTAYKYNFTVKNIIIYFQVLTNSLKFGRYA